MNTLIEKMRTAGDKMVTDEQTQFGILCDIIRYNDVMALEQYATNGYSMNPRNSIFRTPAFLIEYCSVEFVQLLVEKGMNLDVLDISGNNLLHEVLRSDNKEVAFYLLEKGLNPYEQNIEECTALYEAMFSDVFHSEEIISRSTFKDDMSFKKAVLSDNFQLALVIATRDINRLGGLEKILPNIDNSELRSYINRLYDAMLLNGLYREANLLQESMILVTDSLDMTCWTDIPLDGTASMLINNRATLVKVINRTSLLTDGIPYQLNSFYGFVLVSEFDEQGSLVLRKLKSDGQKFIREQEYYVWKFFKIINSKEFHQDISELEKYVENELIRTGRVKMHSTHYYALGMAYFHKGDYINAEYLFNTVMKIAKENNDLSGVEYAKAYAMAKFIQEKRVG